MNNLTKIKQNAFYTLITISTRLLANVILFWLLARFYGPKLFGQFAFVHTLATTFIVFADFGLDVLLTTNIASKKGNKDKIFEKLFALKILLLFCGFLLMQVVAMNFNLSEKFRWLTLIFGFYLVFTSLNNFFVGVFRGYEVFHYEARASLVANLTLVLLTIIFLILRLEIIYVALLFAFTRILGTLVSIQGINKVDPQIRLIPDFSGVKFLKGKAMVFGFHLIFSYLFFQVDTLLLAKLKGDFSVGIYQAVFKLVMLPLVIPDILTFSLMPSLSRYYSENKKDWVKLASSMGRILFVFALPISLIMILYSNELISFIYGIENYSLAVDVLKVFGLIILVRFSLEPFALMLTTSNRQSLRLITVVFATLLNIILNLYVIPKYDVIGASIVSLFVNTFVGLVYILSNPGETQKWFFNFRNILVLFLISIMGVIFYLYFKFNFVIEISLILLVYVFSIYKFYLLDFEKDLIKQSFRKFESLIKE